MQTYGEVTALKRQPADTDMRLYPNIVSVIYELITNITVSSDAKLSLRTEHTHILSLINYYKRWRNDLIL